MKKFINIDYNKIFKNFVNKEDMYVIPVFIPHLGCNNNCVFCNQKKISGVKEKVNKKLITNTIESYLKSFKLDKKIEVAFFGGSFTGLDIDIQKEYLEIVNTYIRLKKITSIRLSTRPDYINEDILKILKEYNVKTIELGVQSMDNNVLNKSKRGHSSEDVINAMKLINKFDFNLGVQIIVGLPGSNKQKDIYTISKLLEYMPKYLRIYPLYVIKDTELYNMYENGEYKPLSFNESVNICVNILDILKNSDVIVIRIGLQSSEEINSNNESLIGPVSDNYCEYVKAIILRNEIENYIIKNNIKDDIIYFKDSIYTSIIIGPKKINKKYFKNKYNIELSVGV